MANQGKGWNVRAVFEVLVDCDILKLLKCRGTRRSRRGFDCEKVT